jgi:Flp pilus assembly protein TadG
MNRLRTGRDERGAAALLFALLATVLFGVGAFAVDIGHAYATRSLEQTDVDTAVLAAAQDLDNGGACNPEVVNTAMDYLQKAENKVSGQPTAIDLGGSADDGDGYIHCDHWRVDLWAPDSHVDFGLGRVLGQDGVDVGAHAAAQIKAAATNATLPFFAVQGCDSGEQSIRNDSGPAAAPPVPTLVPDSATHNGAGFTITPDNVADGTTSATITINGNGMKNVDTVGFTTATGAHFTVTIAKVGGNGTTSFTVSVPSGVLAVEDSWYVRLRTDAGAWSEQTTAQRFQVGPPKLYCDASNEGNFGTIDLPRTDTNSFPLEWNIIKGIQPTLAIHPSPNGECSGKPGSVESKTAPVDGTNCVATEPGLKIAATNAGLVTGKGGLKGRLDAGSTASCSRSGNSDRTPTKINGYNINDDVLSCFITNGAHISDLVAGNVTGTQALSSDIYRSPRFFWIPVLDTDPFSGKKSWPIVGFKPGFISDQSLSATRDAPGTISEFNGLTPDSSGIRELKVVILSDKALPPFAPAVGGEADYTGSGPKALVLVE